MDDTGLYQARDEALRAAIYDRDRLLAIVSGCSAYALIHNHFNFDRHLNNRETFKQNRSAALAERRRLVV